MCHWRSLTSMGHSEVYYVDTHMYTCFKIHPITECFLSSGLILDTGSTVFDHNSFYANYSPPPPDRGAEYCDKRVCLPVCLSMIISSELQIQFSPTCVCVCVTYGHGLVLLWWHSDTFCISGFMNDVIFANKPRLLDVTTQLKCSAHAALGLAINYAQ